jgi:hypothetical protein
VSSSEGLCGWGGLKVGVQVDVQCFENAVGPRLVYSAWEPRNMTKLRDFSWQKNRISRLEVPLSASATRNSKAKAILVRWILRHTTHLPHAMRCQRKMLRPGPGRNSTTNAHTSTSISNQILAISTIFRPRQYFRFRWIPGVIHGRPWPAVKQKSGSHGLAPLASHSSTV